MEDKTQKEKIREKFRNLDDGNFFDTGSDGNLYFHPDKVADWWLEQFDLAIKETEERMVREIEGMAKENIYEVVDFKDIINLIRNK